MIGTVKREWVSVMRGSAWTPSAELRDEPRHPAFLMANVRRSKGTAIKVLIQRRKGGGRVVPRDL